MHQEVNCSNLSTFVHFTQGISYVPIFCVGLILNVLALRVFCFKMNKWTETRIYMTNLALADCLFIFTLPFKMMYKKQSVDLSCLIFESAYFINRYMSIFLITITAIDRYIAIHYPLKARHIRSPLKSAIICGLLWIFIIASIGAAKYYDKRSKPGICFQKTTAAPSNITFAFLICGFLLPLIILSFCSIQVVRKLMKKKTHSQEDKLLQKSINIIFANIVTFTVCFVPLHLAHFIRFIADITNASCAKIEKINIFLNFAAVLASINCCLDAICYYFVSKEFQEASLESDTKYSSHQRQGSSDQDFSKLFSKS